MTNTITLKDVSWVRNQTPILHHVNWNVQKDEQWAILGLNGSGKTSLLNIITGYQFPTSGHVTVLDTTFGRGSLPKMREKIGFVSSSLDKFVATLNKQSVENIILSGKFSSIGVYSNHDITQEDWKHAQDLLTQLNLNYLNNKPFRHLSQGEKRRVLIARALMANPELLILDEPCAGLDLLAREDVLDIIATIPQQHCQLLYVTHYIEEITPTITHVALIKDGTIIQQGAKANILTSKNLTDTFKIPIKVHWDNNRPWITIQR